MYELIDKISHYLPLYLLVFGRLSGMAVTMPIIGYAVVNVRLRVFFAATLTLIIAPMLAPQFTVVYEGFWLLTLDMASEVLVGALIGFGARLLFESFAVAGAFIGYQMGMAIMNVFDPGTQEQQPIIGNFWLMVIVVFFLVTNSHYFLIGTLFHNFKTIALTGAKFSAPAGVELIKAGGFMYDMALRFAAPTMIFLLVVDVALAYMARVMPQLNIFFISLPFKIGAGFVLLILSLQIFQSLFSYVVDQLQNILLVMLRSL